MIDLQHVTKRYGDAVAVDDLSMSIAGGELCVLLGPSGCGKTTTMRMINRMVEPSSGRILVDGTDVSSRPPVELRRSIGYVIQQIGLFPHQDVATNVATVPRLLGWPKSRVATRTDELLTLVGLDPAQFGRRYPHQLSGGQQQRVGVARALAADPPVLLMDEPFGALDPITRANLQDQFRRLQRELGTTVVFVTHDLDEAVRLGDRVAVFAEGGVLQQLAPPAEVLGHPATEYVRSFVGSDRGVKRMGVQHLQADDVVPGGDGDDATGADAPGGAAGGASQAGAVPLGTALSTVLARLLLEPSGRLTVVDGTGRRCGHVDAAALLRAAQRDIS